MVGYSLLNLGVQIMLAVFLLYVLWLVREVRRAPLIDEGCPWCGTTGYVRYEIFTGDEFQSFERPCSCVAGHGKTRRRVA